MLFWRPSLGECCTLGASGPMCRGFQGQLSFDEPSSPGGALCVRSLPWNAISWQKNWALVALGHRVVVSDFREPSKCYTLAVA